MKIIDLHQDILLHQRKQDEYKYKDQTSLEKILKSNIKIVFGTGFVFGKNDNFFDKECLDLIEKDIDEYITFCESEKDFIVIKNREDIELVNVSDNKHGVIIHIEGLNSFSGTKEDWKRLDVFYEKGLRSIGIVWTKENLLGGGNDALEVGLSELGRRVLDWCYKKGVLVDFSHMNQKTFDDSVRLSKIFKKPVFISHGNAKVLCDNNRNYTDDQLRIVQETKGLVGVFFANNCLVNEGLATIDDVVRHIKYICDLIGIEHVALGSDLGGLTANIPEGLRDVFGIGSLYKALIGFGFTEKEVDKIMYQNALDFLRRSI